MQPTSKTNELADLPSIDRAIDQFLAARFDNGQPDPLDPGPFPSLGFKGEKAGSYFMEIEQGDIKVTIWRLTQAFGAPDTYRIMKYRKHIYNGITSWGASSHKDQYMAESLLHAQGIVHHCLTSGGNDDLER